MSVDFAVTQVYRLIADDLAVLFEVYQLYSKYKLENRSWAEYSEILANVMEVEATSYLDHEEPNEFTYFEVVADYVKSVLIRHMLDDLSQYPFWVTKVDISTSNNITGLSIVNEYFDILKTRLLSRNIRTLFEGCIPYLTASMICNYSYLMKATNNFVMMMINKIPSTNALNQETSSKKEFSSSNLLTRSSSKSSKKKRLFRRKEEDEDNEIVEKTYFSLFMEYVNNVVVTTLSHPFLMIAVTMLKYPIYQQTCVFAYFKIVRQQGFQAFYNGLKTRIVFNLIPIPSYYFLGISESIIYRRILGQGSFDSTAGVWSVTREIISSGASAWTLLNYGLLTAAHIVPGFLSFLSMRVFSWLILGSSSHGKKRFERRKEIIQAHLLKLQNKYL